MKLEYGHVMENPFGWEERYERKDLENERHQGKVILILNPIRFWMRTLAVFLTL